MSDQEQPKQPTQHDPQSITPIIEKYIETALAEFKTTGIFTPDDIANRVFEMLNELPMEQKKDIIFAAAWRFIRGMAIANLASGEFKRLSDDEVGSVFPPGGTVH